MPIWREVGRAVRVTSGISSISHMAILIVARSQLLSTNSLLWLYSMKIVPLGALLQESCADLSVGEGALQFADKQQLQSNRQEDQSGARQQSDKESCGDKEREQKT